VQKNTKKDQKKIKKVHFSPKTPKKCRKYGVFWKRLEQMYEITRCPLTGQKHFNGKVHKNNNPSNEVSPSSLYKRPVIGCPHDTVTPLQRSYRHTWPFHESRVR
jgi:hypothetical protein